MMKYKIHFKNAQVPVQLPSLFCAGYSVGVLSNRIYLNYTKQNTAVSYIKQAPISIQAYILIAAKKTLQLNNKTTKRTYLYITKSNTYYDSNL